MSSDQVMLSIPARAEYARTVRMTAAALVGRMGMTFDEVDDVRIAAEEAFVYACDHSPESGTVSIEFSIADRSFEMKVALPDPGRVADEEAERRAAYATFILQSVCDTYEMSSDETGSYLRVVKSATGELANAGA